MRYFEKNKDIPTTINNTRCLSTFYCYNKTERKRGIYDTKKLKYEQRKPHGGLEGVRDGSAGKQDPCKHGFGSSL